MSTLSVESIVLPLSEQQAGRVQDALAGLSPAQLQWVSGYVAGMAAAGSVAPAAEVEAGDALTVLFGSQTGNGQAIAEALANAARAQGFAVKLENLADYKPSSIKREKHVAIVVSTHGEGDPPDDAELFHEFLLADKAPALSGLRYSVLALGDSSYVNFCQTGREIDQRLAELGGQRLGPLVECDLDYDQAALAWREGLLDRLPERLETTASVPHLRAVEAAVSYDKHRPFRAEVLVNQRITGAGSSKDVRHIELSLEGSGIRYEPGDALAVVANNPPVLVGQLIEHLAFDADEVVSVHDRELSVAEALATELEITALNLGFLRAWAERSGSAELGELLQPGQEAALTEFVDSHQVIDVVRRYPAVASAGDFLGMLRKLSPRSYSIASSFDANPDEVHLTVAAVRYEAFGSTHWGAASTYLADRLAEGDDVSVYVEPNPRFRLPADDKPIIMIGPGTGVAPFRAFVEERAERQAPGDNWLIFGDRNFSSDFLYQLEWHRHLKLGNLQRMHVAFSRDQAEKDYVQHRIVENGAEIAAWLERDAVIYVCGDAKRMADDVHRALRDVLVTHGGHTHESAETELKALRRAGRYQRDVY